MSLKDKLNNIDVLDPIREEILFWEDKKYSYFVSDYNHEGQPFARYYFWDLTHDDQSSVNNILSIENFYEFERQLLENDFFHCVGDLRFNLYLILVTSEQNQILYNSDIQFDFKYARKLVLTLDELTTFFGKDMFILMRGKDDKQQAARFSEKEILNQFSIMGKQACQDLDREISHIITLCRTAKKKERKRYLDHLKSAYLAYSSVSNWQEIKPLINNKPQRNFNSDDYFVRLIQQMTIEGYRSFTKRHTIPFKKVNLLYGENGMGKTSLLKAIEFAITGIASESEISNSQPQIEIQCLNTKNREIIFNSAMNYSSLLVPWYNVRSNDPKEFNGMFNRYNYFNTDWASIFAISGKLEINILQLQRFLGIGEVLRREKELKYFYTQLIDLSNCICSREPSIKDFFVGLDNLSLKKARDYARSTIIRCNDNLAKLDSLINDISLEEMLSSHITKIEELFKLLISPNEYSQLKITNGEIVAIHSKTGEEVAMNQMSTGQKVCLALSFMFTLFLSNGGSPNIIMLDEPVANLDSLHMLNLLDVLRRFALSDTQIFFTTANPIIAKLFRRKFSFLEDDFQLLRIVESKTEIKISAEQYIQEQDVPVVVQTF